MFPLPCGRISLKQAERERERERERILKELKYIPHLFDFSASLCISFRTVVSQPRRTKKKYQKKKKTKTKTKQNKKRTFPMIYFQDILKFVFLSTWGDPHYIGLNGLEVYDWNGQLLPISSKSIFSFISFL